MTGERASGAAEGKARRTARHGSSSALQDSVDAVLAQWQVQGVGLDFSPIAVVMRLGRVRTHLDAELTAVFASHDLTAADFQVVVTLRRAGDPYEMQQSRLMAGLALTSGTVSVRLERLEQAGIVTRSPDPTDRRGSLVRLTTRGLELFDRIAPDHLANEDRLLATLEPAERRQLAELLRRLLLAYEDVQSPRAQALGLRLEPAHVTCARRAAVGLPDVTGLLVAEVVTGSPAERAGLQRGDVVTRLAGRPVRGADQVDEALAALAGDQERVDVVAVRGTERLRFVLRPAAAESTRPGPGGRAVRKRADLPRAARPTSRTVRHS